MSEITDPVEREWRRRYDHFKEGHKNAQETIRFVDTKSVVLITQLSTNIAAPLAMVKLLADLSTESSYNISNLLPRGTTAYSIFWAATCVMVLIGLIGIVMATYSISPKKSRRGRCTVLFPLHENNVAAKKNAEEYFKLTSDGLTKEGILDEYVEQLCELGQILEIKFRWNKRADRCVLIQMTLFMVCAAAILFEQVTILLEHLSLQLTYH